MGTPQAAVPSLERLLRDKHEIVAVYTQPDRPAGRGNKIAFSPVKECAEANNLAVFQPLKIKAPETLEVYQSHNADVTIVVAYGRILPATFLNAFPKGAINVHFSLLPKYRGAAPVNWAIVNGEMETGVTTMQMDVGLDTGAVLMQKAVQIGASETSVELMDRLAVVGADLLSETLANLDGIKPIEQDHDRATIAPIMKREDGLIDWEMSAENISRRVRGFQPFPTAFTYWQQARLTIWRAFPLDMNEGSVSKAGEIVAAHGDDLLVGCGDGSILKIDELQPEGKRRMAVRDFLNGFKPRIGAKLGY